MLKQDLDSLGSPSEESLPKPFICHEAIKKLFLMAIWKGSHNPRFLGTKPITIVTPQLILQGCKIFSVRNPDLHSCSPCYTGCWFQTFICHEPASWGGLIQHGQSREVLMYEERGAGGAHSDGWKEGPSPKTNL